MIRLFGVLRLTNKAYHKTEVNASIILWKEVQKQKTAESAVLNSFPPNLFTLCTLQAFAAQDGTKCFYHVLCHFCSFGSAKCLIADALPRVPGTVGSRNARLESFAVLVAAFNQFKVLWYHSCGLEIREQARSKVWSIRPTPFLP